MKRLTIVALGALLLVALVLQIRGVAGERPGAEARSAGGEAGAAAVPSAPVRIAAEGRLEAYPGAEVVLGSDLAGTLESVQAQENTRVRAGQVLAALRAADYRAALDEARAGVAAAEADIRLGEVEQARARTLFEQAFGSQQAVDLKERDLDAARARRESALASARRIEAVIEKTRIVSPIDGVVLERYAQPGEAVKGGARLFRVADLRRVRVEAEVDEFDAGRVAVGALVTVTAEGFEGRSWRGRVEEIPGSVVERGLKPQDPGRPTDTRVLRAKIALLEPTPLKLGQRVEVTIEAVMPGSGADR